MKAIATGLLALACAAPSFADELDRHRPISESNVNSLVLSVVPTTTPLGDGVLQFRVTHRFAQNVDDSTFHDLWGFDSGADIGLGLEYGFSPNLEAGFYRTSFIDEYEAHLKFRWFAQSESFPLSIATRVGGRYLSDPAVTEDEDGYFGQLILQRRFGPVTLIMAPSFVTDTHAHENVTNIPAGFVWQLTESVNLLGEVVARNRDNDAGKTAWRVGIEKRVPGHTFALQFGNSRATTIDMDVASDFPGGFESDDIRVGFNITRRWRW